GLLALGSMALWAPVLRARATEHDGAVTEAEVNVRHAAVGLRDPVLLLEAERLHEPVGGRARILVRDHRRDLRQLGHALVFSAPRVPRATPRPPPRVAGRGLRGPAVPPRTRSPRRREDGRTAAAAAR